MLVLNGVKYNLVDSDSREELHEKVNDLFTEEYTGIINQKSVNDKLKTLHKLISEGDEEGLCGEWFENVVFTQYHLDVKDYLDDMGVCYEVLSKGDILITLGNGSNLLLTRFEDSKNAREAKYIEYISNGLVRDLERYGINLDKTYYLVKNA